ncbi:MAG TPA: SRPBCC domain-containing protein [Streptosporangiaceae bacterium]|nr:SRPBCC domain-containing protein [Streptosporangiaceae bacterium]
MAADLRLRRAFPAPVDQVWQGLTDQAALAQWFWPARFGTVAEVDLRTGGRFRIDGTAGGIAVSGRYVAIERPSRLSFTWIWDGKPEETLVTAELAPAGPGTELNLTHEGFADETERDEHVVGWTDCLDRLPAWLASPGIFSG